MSSIAIVDSTIQTHTVLVSLNDFELIDVVFQLELQLDVEEEPRIADHPGRLEFVD